ncbi:hypothetical protein B2H97_00775 [Paraclostridium bifermentans]|uniref:N-6 DNA methylase n=1 Tax=Paraclostridium bifermentans TaxID=1490 RepID=UPI000A16CD55|nr:class I SAM-dependent DNA methyltransferase [Paraclostridium bifermentans]OSB11673.1 hypothetical protein B2H97_00775 [Paraclostridium bifermentans]
MTHIEFEKKVKNLIDELKSICTRNGLGGTGTEYKVISNIFTYKFLNDKLMHELGYSYDCGKTVEVFLSEISDEEYEGFLSFLPPDTAKMKKTHFIPHLFTLQNKDNFGEILDNTLVEISNLNIEIFSVETSGGTKEGLFSPVTAYISDKDKRNGFAQAIINKIAAFSFNGIFVETFDFFSAIFEYLIKDYNKDSGVYAEYYTPRFSAGIISELLVEEGTKNVTVYDPSAGSGTLLMSIAHKIGEQNCTIYSQDISQKSSTFLRINLILNNLVHSLHNVIQGDTLLDPHHREGQVLKKFDYIVSNPPFKMNFSDDRDNIAADPYSRFSSGVPSIPPKNKDGMPIYLLFIQHIIASLAEKGKACIVVPSGFCTDLTSIPKSIREKLVDSNHINGIIQMPSNIFANTGTSVSLLFIDKNKICDSVIFIDASKLGNKEKIDGIQRTVLNEIDIEKIIDTFKNKKNIDKFSKCVNIEKIKASGYQFNPGRYFDVDFAIEDESDVRQKIKNLINSIEESFIKSSVLQKELKEQLGGIKYGE